jgi:hypothetical protein
MRKWKCLRGISLLFAMFRFNPFLTLRDWLIIFLIRFKSGFFNNITTAKSDDRFDLIYVLAFGSTCICIVLPFWILLWLRWKLTFLLKSESRCEFCKSIFKICHTLSKLSVDCLLLFKECIQYFLKISSWRWSIRKCISMRILKLWCAWNGGCEVCASLFQLKFGWFLQPGLCVCEYGLWLGLWKLFKAWACSWRHSLKEGKVEQSFVECSLVS